MECRTRSRRLIFILRNARQVVAGALVIGTCRLTAALGIAAFLAGTTGCYTYPVRPLAEVSPSTVVTAEISDVGRVALADPIGSGVSRMEGQVVEASDSAIRLAITEVTYLNGSSNKWQGQDVTLRRQDVRSVAQRTYSKQRTVMALVLGVFLAATIVAVGFKGLFGGDVGNEKSGEPPPVN